MMLEGVVNSVSKGFPIVNVVKKYAPQKALSDFVAGITVGLTLIPQSLAYATLAGLPPQYGLYSSLVGGVVYLIFGTVPELNIAPTALLSLFTYSYTRNIRISNTQAAVLFCFFGGLIELCCGVFQLGFLVDFVSTPVVAAFTSAGAITIVTSQVRNLLGLTYKADTFTSIWVNLFGHIHETKIPDAALGLSCCVILISMRKLKDLGVAPLEGDGDKLDSSNAPTKLKKFLWMCSVSRNALVVVLSAALAFSLEQYGIQAFTITAPVEPGLPSIAVPALTANVNGTELSFTEIVTTELGMAILVVPFIAILVNIAISKAFANGKVVDASQEMVALGLCNVVGSFCSSYPVSASFCRAAVSNASGVKTPVAGIYTSTIVILALTFLTPYFTFIPIPTLSAVIICAVLFMIEIELTQIIWKTNKMDFVPFTITLLSCLFISIEIGILIGMAADVLLLLYYNARPNVLIEKTVSENGVHYIKVTPLATTLFPSAEYIREKIMQGCSVGTDEGYSYVVFDCYRMRRIDFTAAKCLAALVFDLHKMRKSVVFYRPKESVQTVIRNVCKKANVQFAQSESEMFASISDKQEQMMPTVVNNSIQLATLMCNGTNDNRETAAAEFTFTPPTVHI